MIANGALGPGGVAFDLGITSGDTTLKIANGFALAGGGVTTFGTSSTRYAIWNTSTRQETFAVNVGGYNQSLSFPPADLAGMETVLACGRSCVDRERRCARCDDSSCARMTTNVDRMVSSFACRKSSFDRMVSKPARKKSSSHRGETYRAPPWSICTCNTTAMLGFDLYKEN